MALEACIACLSDGDIAGAMDAIIGFRFPYFSDPTKEEIGREIAHLRHYREYADLDAPTDKELHAACADVSRRRDLGTLDVMDARDKGEEVVQARRKAETKYNLPLGSLDDVCKKPRKKNKAAKEDKRI